MMILSKNGRMGSRKEMLKKPFPRDTRDGKEVAFRIGNDFFENVKMVSISLGR